MSEPCSTCPPVQGTPVVSATQSETVATVQEVSSQLPGCTDATTESSCGCEATQTVCKSPTLISKKAAPTAVPFGTQAEEVDCTDTEGAVILARKGKSFAKFVGDGFLQVIKGKAFITNSIKMKVMNLWHQWVPIPGSGKAILGDPKPFPYQIILDAEGNPFGLRGFNDADSITVWDFSSQMWEVRRTSDFPMCHRGKIPHDCDPTSNDEISLVGLAPMATDQSDPANVVRCIRGFNREGIISIHQVESPAIASDCGDCFGTLQQATDQKFQYVARVTPFPTDDQEYTIKWSKASGFTFVSTSVTSDTTCPVAGGTTCQSC